MVDLATPHTICLPFLVFLPASVQAGGSEDASVLSVNQDQVFTQKKPVSKDASA